VIEEGSVCIVRAGRNAGQLVVVTRVLDDIYVTVVGPGIKGEKRYNKRHLTPIGKKISISGKPEDIISALEAL